MPETLAPAATAPAPAHSIPGMALVPTGAPLLCRNTIDGPLILSLDPKGSDFIEWQAAGDSNGGDVQIVPESFHKNVAFLRIVQRGIIIIENAEDNPSVALALGKQNAAWANRNSVQQAEAEASISRESNNDLIEMQCVGPNPRGQGACENTIPVREMQKNDKPPLCNTHEDLAPQYVPYDETVNGKIVKKWSRVQMTQRERQQS